MRHQEFELFITILFFVAVLFFAYRSNKGGKRFDPKNYGSGPGQFFDKETYAGNIRGMVIFCLVVALSGHIDEINRWIGSQFGEELIVSPGKEAWHQVVARSMGIVGIIFTLINLQSIYAKRKKTALLPYLAEEPSAPSPTNTVDSMGSSTKQPHAESEISHSQKRD